MRIDSVESYVGHFIKIKMIKVISFIYLESSNRQKDRLVQTQCFQLE